MTVLLSLLPVLVLLGGASLYLLPLALLARYRYLIPALTCALAAAALAALSRIVPDPVTLFEPSAILPALTFTLQWNGAAPVFGLLLLSFTTARFIFDADGDGRAFGVGTLVVCAGALVLFAADNWTTVTAAWVIVELGLLIVPEGDAENSARVVTAFGWNLSAIVLWLSAGLMLANQGVSLRLQEVTLGGMPALLVFVAIWIRSGLYPLHATAPTNIPTAGVRFGIPMLLAGYLMTRFLAASQGAMDFSAEMQIVAVLAAGVSALLVVSVPHGAGAFDWLLRAFGAALLLLPFLGEPQTAAAAAVWLTLGAFTLIALVSLAWSWRAQLPGLPLTALVWIGALVLAAALPLAPAFLGRVAVLSAAYAQGLAWWLLPVASAALYLIPLWREIFASREVAPKEPSRLEFAALALIVLPVLALVFLSNYFMQPFGPLVQSGADATWNALWRASNTNVLIFAVAGLVVPVLAAFELARRWERRAGLLPAQVAAVLDLNRVTALLDAGYRFGRALIQQSLGLLEQPPIAWLIFLAIWVAVWITGLGR